MSSFVENLNSAVDNMGVFSALYYNYDNIKSANEKAAFGLLNAINVASNVIGVNSTIGPNQNAISFGDITIAAGITVTVEQNSEWAII